MAKVKKMSEVEFQEPAREAQAVSPKHREIVKSNSIYDKIAGDTFYYLNYYYAGGKEKYPHDHQEHMRRVSRFYPNAIGGAILMDEMRYPGDAADFAEKAKIMKQFGFRYVIIDRSKKESDILEQLA